MAEDNKLNSAKQIVLRFVWEWTAWETKMYREKISFENVQMREIRSDIIRKYCTIKKRGYIDSTMCYSNPPVYQDAVEENVYNVELTAPNRIHVDVRCSSRFYRFVVFKKRDGWRIDSVKWKVAENQDWQTGLIGI